MPRVLGWKKVILVLHVDSKIIALEQQNITNYVVVAGTTAAKKQAASRVTVEQAS